MAEALIVLIVIAIVMLFVFWAFEFDYYKRKKEEAERCLKRCEDIREEFIARRELSPILSDFQVLENNITRVKEILHEMDEKHMQMRLKKDDLYNSEAKEETEND